MALPPYLRVLRDHPYLASLLEPSYTLIIVALTWLELLSQTIITNTTATWIYNAIDKKK